VDSLWIAATIAVLVIVNGLFVGAEFALVRAPRTRVDHLTEQGRKVAGWLGRILRDARLQGHYIVTTQLGVTGASLGLGMYGEHAIAERLAPMLESLELGGPVLAHAIASGAALALLTYLHVVVGEMLPKTVALGQPLRFALTITPVVLSLRVLLFPLVVAVEWMSHRLLRAVGIDRRVASSGSFYNIRDLQHIVQQSQDEGMLQKTSGDVLHDLFEFGELSAGEAMVPRVAIEGIPLGCAPDEIAAIVERKRHTRYPVYEDDLDHIIGMAHIKDLLLHLRAGQPLQRQAVRAVPFLPETARLDKVLAKMRGSRSHMAIVMDEHGGTAGLITEEDLFEEVVGNIDEARRVNAEPRASRGRLRVAGTMRLDELGEQLAMELEHEETDTVSGLVLMLLERPARVGDIVEHAGLRLEVTAVEGRGVKECAVQTTAPPA
jgi:CBS domain containing-hemolysin-like protein